MSKMNKKNSLQVPLSFFIFGTLSTASTAIALEKYQVALLAVSIAGLCILIIGLVIKVINWLHPDGE